ncbi:PRC-barrel domain protein [Nitrosococcus halophilus Nc 4]|uniref:PRC-barrel domain protein n=1 Tax=Nitrosococcus halophilus (strain Nc4) TaxID=472759 RepID=D5C1V6_NITHN|nr:PRC-barrel domain-containing protein [Nitrosococcus halophilus]ADE14739.1 PRC-barrel domain protein [Nitrosococcus halophilus Nc 4]
MNKLILKPLQKHKIFIIVGFFSVMLAGASLSAEQDSPQRQMERDQGVESKRQIKEQKSRPLYKASVLRDREVKNSEGEQLGRIADLVFSKSGKVKYAVLQHGGTLGIGGEMTAVPWNTLQISEKGKYYILNVSKEQLADAPTFSEENWPTHAQWTVNQTYSKTESTSQQFTFMNLDKDQDGYVSKDEAKKYQVLNTKFNQIDQNRDEKIDRSEFSAFETIETEERGGNKERQPNKQQ